MLKSKAKTMSIVELLTMLSTENKAVKWLEDIRWGGRPVCPHCGCCEDISKPKSKKITYWCKHCRYNFTVKTGTVMHGSNAKTRQWVVAIYYVLTARKGISSRQLSKEFGATQKTAWFMLQRIHEACKQGSFKLVKVAEIDGTCIGGKSSTSVTTRR